MLLAAKGLRWCGYPNWALQEEQFKEKKAKNTEQWSYPSGEIPTRKKHIVVPYVHSMNERLQSMYKKHNIGLHFKPGYTICQALVALKDKLQTDEKQGVVYSVRCVGCEEE